ncbi:MAG: UvrD-helicase domain-containing protein, partial [Gammaproteobacteria bacterium]|nr:UvrD-helicase domain-containing protein [Gammaproteobacteria bacterium]
MLGAGQSVLTHYAEAKREAGLVDYTDMVALAYRLLREDPRVAEILARRADCVVIDEFQDTNPIQFALLWRLRAAGVPALVVGDLKQAIMGFQGADPRLLETLERQNRHAREPLSHNWRSQPSLMAFINAMGSGLFGDDYVRLEPKAPSSVLESLEVVAFAERPPRKQHRVRAAHVGLRIRTLLEGGAQTVIDRRTRQLRPLRGGDIAVLCPTNNLLAIYAEVLRRLGLRVRLPESGWFDSRVVQIAWHAFTYLANPEDRHAALYLAVTELGSLELKDALAQLIEEGRIEEPLLERLDALGAGVSDSAVDGVIADTIAALKLFDVIASWPDAEQARANLLRLNGEAKEFMSANREALASGGFHGSGLPTFMAWL